MRETKTNRPIVDPDAMDISKEKFRELADMTVSFVESCGLGTDSFMPHVFVHHRELTEALQLGEIEHTVCGIAQNFNDHDEKHMVMRSLGRKFYQERKFPAAVFMATEAWISKASKDGKPEYDYPSQDPNRAEVLIIAGGTLMGDETIGVSIPVKRDEKNLMQRGGENVVCDKIESALLGSFFRGYFEGPAREMGREI